MADPDDVPSGIDLRDPATARTWTREADAKRPWRAELRATIARIVKAASAARVLELGSGPGQLAEAILQACEIESYTLLDFSPPFLELARERLRGHAAARFVLADFKQPDWVNAVEPPFDAVVTMQAVHELRHKRYAEALYRQVRDVLRPGGVLVVCDHEPFDDSARAIHLHATEAEQHAAMHGAGLVDVRTEAALHRMYVCSARR